MDNFIDETYHGDANADVNFYGYHAWDNSTDVKEFQIIVNGKDYNDV
jgi:hypothetical protein